MSHALTVRCTGASSDPALDRGNAARDNYVWCHERVPIIPHSDFGDPECCGCLFRVVQGDLAEIVCTECLVVVRTIPASDLQRTLDEMELEGDVASAVCPHCGATHLAPGFSMLWHSFAITAARWLNCRMIRASNRFSGNNDGRNTFRTRR